MSRATRIDLYKKIEEHRKRPLLVYVTSKREGVSANKMATDALPNIIEQLDAIPSGSKELDFMIASYGGDPMVAWRIVSLIRQRVEKLSVLIPQSAYSAATLVALGANEIVMHPNSHLGPVDMQITTFNEAGQARQFSTEDVSAFLDFVRENLKITDQAHVRALFEAICKELSSHGIGFTARSSKLALDLGERLLALHMTEDDSRTRLRLLVENMSRKFKSHSYPINRSEAIGLGLPVGDPRDPVLEQLMWAAWLDIEEEMKERIPFHPLIELLNSSEKDKLLAPQPVTPPVAPSAPPAPVVPPIPGFPPDAPDAQNLPPPAPNVLIQATDTVLPVDFELKNAIVESSRITHTYLTRGKILSCKAPDLAINFNVLTTFRGWERENSTP